MNFICVHLFTYTHKQNQNSHTKKRRSRRDWFGEQKKVKNDIREELEEHGICHAILETEDEACSDTECNPELSTDIGHHHHHH